MKEFKVEITETLLRVIEVRANNSTQALEKVKLMYEQESIILDSNDFVDKEIKALNDEY